MSSSPPSSPSPLERFTDPAGPWRRNHAGFLAVFAGVVFLLGCGVIFIDRQSSKRPPLPTIVSTKVIDAFPQPIDTMPIETVPIETMPVIALPDASSDAAEAADVGPSSPQEQLQVSDPGSAVILQVRGVPNDSGRVRIAIYDSASAFQDVERALHLMHTPIVDGRARLQLNPASLPDRFAVTVYHDANDNGVMDRTLFGIPSEAYGFSNGARGATGPPSYDDAVIDRPPPGDGLFVDLK